MNITLTKISVAIALVVAATAASAQVYGEVAYTGLTYEEEGGKADLGTLGATIGYEINKNLAVEGMFAAGVQDDDVDVGGFNVNVDLKNTYGVFLKPKAELAENLEVYARLGWAKSKIEASAFGQTMSDSGSDFAYGVGLQYSFSPTTYVTGSYTNLYDKEGTTIDGWGIGIGYKF
ncbi:MAG: porin family protein [Georgfuchsia sp.]